MTIVAVFPQSDHIRRICHTFWIHESWRWTDFLSFVLLVSKISSKSIDFVPSFMFCMFSKNFYIYLPFSSVHVDTQTKTTQNMEYKRKIQRKRMFTSKRCENLLLFSSGVRNKKTLYTKGCVVDVLTTIKKKFYCVLVVYCLIWGFLQNKSFLCMWEEHEENKSKSTKA